MSDMAFNAVMNEVDSFSYNQVVALMVRLTQALQKRTSLSEQGIDEDEVERINAVYTKIPREEQISATKSSMLSMWEAVKNDSW